MACMARPGTLTRVRRSPERAAASQHRAGGAVVFLSFWCESGFLIPKTFVYFENEPKNTAPAESRHTPTRRQ